MTSDWFHRLMGFREENYDVTRERLRVEGDELVSTVNDNRYRIGSLTVPTLAELRSRIEVPVGGRSKVRCVTGDARAMHAEPEHEGALIQVASRSYRSPVLPGSRSGWSTQMASRNTSSRPRRPRLVNLATRS